MNVLITGGAGFIGSHLVERLLARARVRVIDNFSTGRRENLPADGRVELIEGDVRDTAAVEAAVRGTQAIVHLAAVASVQASIDDPIGTHRVNLDGTLHLLEAARRHSVQRFVYASSAAVYGDVAELPVAEETTPRPLSPYAADKLGGEHYVQFYHRQHGLAATSFRFFNIYGPRQDPSSPYSGVISVFTDRIRKGAPVTIYGDGRQTRDFVYVGDLAEILFRSLESPATVGEIVNIGRGVECSLLELLAELERLAGRSIERRHEPARAGDILRSCADMRRLRRLMGTVPGTPLGEGLERLLRYNSVLN